MIGIAMVALGGLAGAISRFGVQKAIPERVLPSATLAVNLLGSFMLGLIAGSGIQGHLYLLTATGFMGAFTTFSTLNVDLVKLVNNKQIKTVFIYIVSTYIGGLLCVAAGLFIGRLI